MEKTLGEVLREARVAKGFGLRAFARKLEVTPSYLSDIENDRRVPSEDVMSRLASALELDLDRLMAMAGRIGGDAQRYMQRTPAVGALFRTISDRRLGPSDLEQLRQKAEKLGKGRRRPER